ncbi:uncharacterized protein LOC132611321 isoform X1 [Lycium barbarum]|uniref:uncharacterized protein LOC132611321 isoform X1 n=1 Tax=Lycium barbarum TaxID=112863 RepID=UPI00293E27A3|nr:uncharacterized protein LOC132611321 isoform X1 [Lycium barbarum]
MKTEAENTPSINNRLSLQLACNLIGKNMDETGDMCNDGSTPMIIDAMTAPSPATGPITEDEIRAFLLQGKSVSTADLVLQFRSRLKSKEGAAATTHKCDPTRQGLGRAKGAFAAVLRRICKIQKIRTGASYVVLREEGELLDTLIATDFFHLEF